MKRAKGKHWKIDSNTVRVQIKTKVSQHELEEVLQGWKCVSYGYIPKTSEDIYVFEKKFDSELDWANFINSDKIKNLIEMKEVKHE